MAVSKVILNGTTLIDVTQKTVTPASMLNGVTALKNDGTDIVGSYVAPTFATQSKTVSPTTSQQTISPDAGYDGLSSVTVNAMPGGSATTPATTITANPTISVSSGGLITASVSGSKSVTPSVSAGYVSSGTAGTVTVNGSATQQLTAQAAQTITPTTTNQTIASGKYLTGTQTILGDANLLAENIADGVTIFGVTGTHSGGGGSAKTVTITLDNPVSPEGFSSFTIYEETDGVKGSLIGSITSPTGSTTVTVSASANGLRCELSGSYVFVHVDSLAFSVTSGNIGLRNFDGASTISYVIAGDGAIQIDWIEWDD